MTKKQTTPTSSNTPDETAIKEEVKKINSIHVLAQWKGFSPDCRPYKPSTPILEFAPEPLTIEVDVPLVKEFVVNWLNLSTNEMSGLTMDKPRFTPLGMRYIIDQFESVMQNPKNEVEEPAADDDWGDDPEEEFVPTGKAKSTNDEWDDEAEADQSESEKDKDFDEEW